MTLRPSLGSLGRSSSSSSAVRRATSASASATSVRISLAVVADSVGEHLAGGRGVLDALPRSSVLRLDDGVELLVALGQLAVLVLVGEDVGVGEAGLDVGELALQGLEAVQHQAAAPARPVRQSSAHGHDLGRHGQVRGQVGGDRAAASRLGDGQHQAGAGARG